MTKFINLEEFAISMKKKEKKIHVRTEIDVDLAEIKKSHLKIRKLIEEMGMINERAKISDDGRSLVVRIPTRVRDAFKIKKGQYMRFSGPIMTESSEGHLTNKTMVKKEFNIKIESGDTIETTTMKDEAKELKDDFARSPHYFSHQSRILDVLLANRHFDKWLSTNDIAKKSGLNWKTAFAALCILFEDNFALKRDFGKKRKFKRAGKKVESIPMIKWKFNAEVLKH